MMTHVPGEVKCSKCGRTPVFGARFCPYCGTTLSATARRHAAVPLPDRNSLNCQCAIISCGKTLADVARVGRIVAEALNAPLPDITRQIKVSRGIFARSVEAAAARKLADELERAGHPVAVIPDSDLESFPPMMRMTNVSFSEDGLRCEAYNWDATERMELTWDRILLVSCGKLVCQEVVEIEETAGENEKEREKLRPIKMLPFGEKIPRLETRTRHEYVLDVFCREPWLRLRLDENPTGYALVDVGLLAEGKRVFYRAAKEVTRFAASVPVNEGVRLLAENAPGDLWEPLTFEDKRDFDSYNAWLLLLTKYGLPIPAEA